MLIGGFQKCSLIDYPEKISAIVFTQGCNFRCPYCHNPELLMQNCSSLIDESYVLDFLKSRIGKLDAVVISGGEPCLQKGLIEFIKKVKGIGFLIKLDTNGSFPEKLKLIIDSKLVDYIAMDIKAPLDKYNSIINSSVSTEKINESINLIMNSGINYEFRTTVVKSLLLEKDLYEIGELISGTSSYYLQKFVPANVLNKNFEKEVSYSNEEFEKFKNQLETLVNRCYIR